jgi:hypothetical protein
MTTKIVHFHKNLTIIGKSHSKKDESNREDSLLIEKKTLSQDIYKCNHYLLCYNSYIWGGELG